MPVDYSKWDALELSDDSDVEVHPNVDKRSFIRAKQNQIHQQRFDRKHRITTLRYEKVINDGLLSRIDALVKSLEGHRKDVEGKPASSDVDEVVFDSLLDVNSDESLGNDQPPSPPEGVHSQEQQPSYSKMMGALVDQVKAEIDKSKAEGTARYEAYIREAGTHYKKVQGLQIELMKELTRLEKEDGAKITSESIHTGFDSSFVSKTGTAAPAGKPAPMVSGSGPELLNPNRPTPETPGGETSGSAADIEDGDEDEAPGEDDDIQASAAAKAFGKIKFGDYKASLQFIGQNSQILKESESDGLLVEAFNAQSRASAADCPPAQAHGDSEYARQCVEKALLLQYCRQLGRDGVQLFFKRIQTPEHQARKLFLDDVHRTYARIRSRTAELAREQEEAGDGDREQIQLHAVDPGTKINIVTPVPLDQCQSDDERIARQIFETFPPGLQRALESGSLDKVNVVLGKMSVSEAEEIVEQLGNGGMLSMEQGVIDATTEEGRKQVEEIERSRAMPGEQPRVGDITEQHEQPSFADEVD
ncbi:Hsp90 co-chaperone Cdc37 [Polychaeton citri CBS 116435]|uniref:Hsp90 chaperone protein kinase-targeting subunit n=1 Tax=Polychaeton citri CBS 116435 TaxID=1314669 RepID=A0A9P4UP92_9PEZI|nr:Hsp90 co-chaperone Cdc37 [Polychaeton citri CBS 116435]